MRLVDLLAEGFRIFGNTKNRLQAEGFNLYGCCEQATMQIMTGVQLHDFLYTDTTIISRSKLTLLGKVTGYTDEGIGYQGKPISTSTRERRQIRELNENSGKLAREIVSNNAVALIGVRSQGESQRLPDHVVGLCGGGNQAFLVDVRGTGKIISIGDVGNVQATIQESLKTADICIFHRKNN